MKNNILKIVITVIVLGLITWFIYSIVKSQQADNNKRPRDKSQKSVDAFIVKPQLLSNDISVSGTLLAFEEVELKNEVSGRIVELNLPEGQFVKKGTLLVKLYDADLQANLSKLESQLKMQEQVFQRQAELYKLNGISQNELEQTGLLVSTIKSDIAAVNAQIRKTEILAPFDGIIGLRNVSIGAVVSASTNLATIRTDNQLKLDFYVPEKYASLLCNGMKVHFTLFNSKNIYDATVMATESGVESESRNLKVRAVVESNAKELVPGSFANVLLRLGEDAKALLIPTQAIIPKELSKKVIIAKSGKAHFVPVKTGLRQASFIEVTEGLLPGDTVITSGLLFLKEGSKLKYAIITDSL